MLPILAKACEDWGISLSEAQVTLFERYLDDLYKTNEVMNLTRVPREDAELRHLVDSLLVASLIPQGAEVVDVGSGPGLPAFPLACLRPDLTVTALDSSGKMVSFLGRHPLPNLKVILGRAEEVRLRDSSDVATGRAVAPLSIQLELSAPLVRLGGLVIPFRSVAERGSFECPAAYSLGLKLLEVVESVLPGTDVIRLFPVYEKATKTPAVYPRPWAQIRANPL